MALEISAISLRGRTIGRLKSDVCQNCDATAPTLWRVLILLDERVALGDLYKVTPAQLATAGGPAQEGSLPCMMSVLLRSERAQDPVS